MWIVCGQSEYESMMLFDRVIASRPFRLRSKCSICSRRFESRRWSHWDQALSSGFLDIGWEYPSSLGPVPRIVLTLQCRHVRSTPDSFGIQTKINEKTQQRKTYPISFEYDPPPFISIKYSYTTMLRNVLLGSMEIFLLRFQPHLQLTVSHEHALNVFSFVKQKVFFLLFLFILFLMLQNRVRILPVIPYEETNSIPWFRYCSSKTKWMHTFKPVRLVSLYYYLW